MKRLLQLITIVFAAHSFMVNAQDANYPNRPITWIVPMGAGGTSDVFARTIQPFISNYLGQPMVVDNKSGANGVLGEELGFNAKPDGYTIIMGNIGPNAINYSPVSYTHLTLPTIYSV